MADCRVMDDSVRGLNEDEGGMRERGIQMDI